MTHSSAMCSAPSTPCPGRRRRRQRVAAAAALALLAGVAAGCSSNTGSSTTAAGTAAGTTVTIGSIGDYSGDLASTFGGIPKALNAWASTVNASGGLNGAHVRVVNEDVGSGLASAGLTAAETLVQQDQAIAVIDFDNNDGTWIPYLSKNNVPVIPGAPASPVPLTTTDAFPITASIVSYVAAITAQAKAAGDKVGLGYCPQCAAVPQLTKVFADEMGLQVPVSAELTNASPDYTGFCQQLISAGVQTYVLSEPSAVITRISNQCSQQGLKAKLILNAYDANSTWKTDPAYEGAIVLDTIGIPFWNTSIPAGQAYRAAMSKYTTGVLGTELDNDYPQMAWAAGKLIGTAAQSAHGQLTGPSLKTALYGLHDATLDGLTVPLTYSQSHPTNLLCYFVWGVSNGQFSMPGGTSTPLQPKCLPQAEIQPVVTSMLKSAGN